MAFLDTEASPNRFLLDALLMAAVWDVFQENSKILECGYSVTQIDIEVPANVKMPSRKCEAQLIPE
jgi:hypothetical protein